MRPQRSKLPAVYVPGTRKQHVWRLRHANGYGTERRWSADMQACALNTQMTSANSPCLNRLGQFLTSSQCESVPPALGGCHLSLKLLNQFAACVTSLYRMQSVP